MAATRSRSLLAPLLALAAVLAVACWASAPAAFLQSRPALRGGEPVAVGLMAAAAAAATPAAAQAVDLPPEAMDVGSSLSLAGLTEVLMCGIVMGIVPTTYLGLMVAAWLQFKKGPTLGI
mmetsp:Transcript_109268/g.352744  ORF Transcript_109268/g.352744 Transcript_109268/m.352744 type:complete len:120 (+) Transcript_109268:78-437(+)